MKIVGKLFEQMGGIEIYPIISLLLFIAIFLVVLFRVFKMDKKLANKMARFPLDEENEDLNTNQNPINHG